MIRIGHKGAAALAPENTLASIEAALEAGVDMVEVDVVALPDGALVLAHSLEELGPEPLPLDEALAFLARTSTGVQLDVKRPGYEDGLVDAVRRHDLTDRTLVSSCHASTLLAVARREPGLRRGFTYPYDRHRTSGRRLLQPVVPAALAGLRATLPRRIGRMLERADASVAVLHYGVVSRAAVRRCHVRGAEVFAWTVDDPGLCRRLADLGVDGIVTNDPRVFSATL